MLEKQFKNSMNVLTGKKMNLGILLNMVSVVCYLSYV